MEPENGTLVSKEKRLPKPRKISDSMLVFGGVLG